MLTITAILFFLTMALDIYVTRRILKNNPDRELNGFVRWVLKHSDPTTAAFLGIIPMRMLSAAITLPFSPMLFALLVGMYCDHAYKQLWVLKHKLI